MNHQSNQRQQSLNTLVLSTRPDPRKFAVSAMLGTVLLVTACGGGENSAAPQIQAKSALEQAMAVNAKLSAAGAAHRLNMATFGATTASVAELRAMPSYQAWLEGQIAIPVNRTHWDTLKAIDDANVGFPQKAFGGRVHSVSIIPVMWQAYITAPDQLRKRMGAALLEIFAINERVGAIGYIHNQYSSAGYVDMLERHAFGNFRDLLEDVALSPAMGNFLSHIGNQKAAYANGVEIRVPDENFARELLQLFSIGLVKLNANGTPMLSAGKPIPTYTQEDIFQLARVFTGFNYDTKGEWLERYRARMVSVPWSHSPEEKRFLGLTIPANTSAKESLKQALDHIFKHPNVGPFIGKQLIQRLVTSNPSPAYIARVSAAFANNGKGVRGDMKAVVLAVLTDAEATDLTSAALNADHLGKLREPMMRITAVARALGASSPGLIFPMGDLTAGKTWVGQTPVNSPSVFNFFRPGYVPPSSLVAQAGLVAPELQISTGSQIVASINAVNELIADKQGVFQWTAMANMERLASDPKALLDECIVLLTGNGTGLAPRASMEAIVAGIPANEARLRVQTAMQMVASSPAFIVQR